MKFAIAPVAYWDSIGFDTTEWRKSLDGTKAICHLDYAEKLGLNLYENSQVKIYDIDDPNLDTELEATEWVVAGTNGDLDIYSFLVKLGQFETKLNNAVTARIIAAETELEQKTEKNKQDIAKTDTKLEGYITTNEQDKLSLTTQLQQKANRDEVANGLTAKGASLYASLPTTGNAIGDYYYCSDGNGVDPAGNYVWNGAVWYFGGTGDDGYNALNETLNNLRVEQKQLFDRNAVEVGYWSQANQHVTTGAGLNYVNASIDVSQLNGETIYFSIDGLPVEARFVNRYSVGFDGSIENATEFTVPAGTKNIIVSYKNPSVSPEYKYFQAEINGITPYCDYGKTLIEVDSLTRKEVPKQLIDFSTTTIGYVNTSNVITTNGAAVYYRYTAKIDVSKYAGKTLYFSIDGVPVTAKYIVAYNASGTFLAGRSFGDANQYVVNADGLTTHLIVSFRNYDYEQYKHYAHFQMELDAITPYVAYGSAQTLLDQDINDYLVGLANIRSRKSNVLYGKNYWACGDSFTAYTNKQFADGKYVGLDATYPYLIGERNNMNVVNIAVSGSTISNVIANNFSDSKYTTIDADADYITMFFGINDEGNAAPIGTIDDATNSTFYGAWNIVLEYLITNHPFAKIGVICGNGMGTLYTEAIRTVCEKWGIPYLDMDADNSVPLMHRTNRNISQVAKDLRLNAFKISDIDTHPNYKAHEYESTFIENWLRGL